MTKSHAQDLREQIGKTEEFIAELTAMQDKLAREGVGLLTHIIQCQGVSLKFDQRAGGCGNPRPARLSEATRFTPASALRTSMLVKNGNGTMGQPIRIEQAIVATIEGQTALRDTLAQALLDCASTEQAS